jgi:nucleoside-diphosphate-sugar epimerase
MKVLVTGGTGFIGSYLARYLDKIGYDVTICDNNSRGKLDDSVKDLKFIECDLTNKSDLEKLDTDYDYVYHLAAINGTPNFYEIPHLVLKVNTICNINILDWCVENNIKNILSASSSEIYASTDNIQIPTSEDVIASIDDVHNERFSYAGSKIFGELLFINYAKQYGLNTKIIRPHNIYGSRMGFEHVIPQVVRRIFDEESPFKIYGHYQTRSFCHINDCVKQIKNVMESKTNDIVFNVGSGKETNIRELVETIFDILNYDPYVLLVDAPKGSTDRRCPDMSLLKSIGGYSDEVSLFDGLKETCEWYMWDCYEKI